MDDSYIRAIVNDYTRKVEQSIFDRSAKNQRRQILTVSTERYIVGGLVMSSCGTVTSRNNMIIQQIVQTDYVTPVTTWKVAKCNATMTVAWIERNKQTHSGIVKKSLDDRTPGNTQIYVQLHITIDAIQVTLARSEERVACLT
jgi:hypothetical protein